MSQRRWLEPVAAASNVAVVLTSTDAANISVVGFGGALATGLAAWSKPPGASGLANGLRTALSSDAVHTWVAELPNVLHPQISPPRTAATSYRCVGGQSLLYNNWNTGSVQNGGTPSTFSTGGNPYCVVSISTYHWNDGKGQTPGTITLASSIGSTLGPWQATGSSGQGEAPNVNWTATPGSPTQPVIIDGTYTCIDSNPATWSQNTGSGGSGFCKVTVQPAIAG